MRLFQFRIELELNTTQNYIRLRYAGNIDNQKFETEQGRVDIGEIRCGDSDGEMRDRYQKAEATAPPQERRKIASVTN